MGLIFLDYRDKVAAAVREAAAAALTDGAEHLLFEANKTVPIEEHTLEGSGTVDPATPQSLVARVGYGGAASAYAARQHEETGWRHDAGRRAKWLELTCKEQVEPIGVFLADSMREVLG